jgi:hypothetical protein
MTLPGFAAGVSLYTTFRHYYAIRAFNQVIGARPQQLSVQEFAFPGLRHCGPCYWDQTGACVQDCVICPPGQLPDGCEDFTVPCRSPGHCPPCGPCTCTKNCGGTQLPC